MKLSSDLRIIATQCLMIVRGEKRAQSISGISSCRILAFYKLGHCICEWIGGKTLIKNLSEALRNSGVVECPLCTKSGRSG